MSGTSNPLAPQPLVAVRLAAAATHEIKLVTLLS
jgi:hypothetical protein